jgi:urease accessory protein
MHSSQLSQQNWQGKLHLEFTEDQGATRLAQCQVQAPLKVQRPFYPEGEQVCHCVALHTAGGVVGGDRLSLTLDLHPRAHALLTTAAAGKIYRSNGLVAEQSTRIQVAEAAVLEWFPQEVIVFDGADYRQDLRVELGQGAIWLGWEVTRLGRSARGETFLTGEWRSHTEVWQGDRLLWVDPQWVKGGSAMLTSLHGLAGYPVIASFVLIGREVSKDLVGKVRSLWYGEGQEDDFSLPQTPNPDVAEIGVTRLMSGLLCRYRGRSTAEARRWFVAVWSLLRQDYLDRPSCKPRVWF